MKTLAIDTSTNILGVALLEDEQVLGEVVTQIKKDHSTRLMPTIVSLMDDLNIQPDELAKIVVAQGPGSYTGVRIGITTAKSMAWALNIPIYSVSSLNVLTYNGRFFNGLIFPFFDARRNNVFTGLYEWKDGNHIQHQTDTYISMETMLTELAQLKRDVLFLSPHIEQYKDLITEIVDQHAIIPEGPYHFLKPAFLGLASRGKDEENVHLLSPNYLRLAEAEANWLKRQEGVE